MRLNAEAQDYLLNGKLLGQLEFLNEGPVEMDAAFGSELDARIYTSLAGLHSGRWASSRATGLKDRPVTKQSSTARASPAGVRGQHSRSALWNDQCWRMGRCSPFGNFAGSKAKTLRHASPYFGF